MLTYLERKMLKELVMISDGKIQTLLFDYIEEEYLSKKFTEDEIKLALSGLEYEQMITMRIPPYGESRIPIDITPTFKGLRYAALRKEQFIQFVLTSLLVPISISLIVTVITLWFS